MRIVIVLILVAVAGIATLRLIATNGATPTDPPPHAAEPSPPSPAADWHDPQQRASDPDGFLTHTLAQLDAESNRLRELIARKRNEVSAGELNVATKIASAESLAARLDALKAAYRAADSGDRWPVELDGSPHSRAAAQHRIVTDARKLDDLRARAAEDRRRADALRTEIEQLGRLAERTAAARRDAQEQLLALRQSAEQADTRQLAARLRQIALDIEEFGGAGKGEIKSIDELAAGAAPPVTDDVAREFETLINEPAAAEPTEPAP